MEAIGAGTLMRPRKWTIFTRFPQLCEDGQSALACHSLGPCTLVQSPSRDREFPIAAQSREMSLL